MTLNDIIAQLSISIVGGGGGAIIGAYFGLRFAREWDREKRREENQQTENRVLDAIIEELKNMQKRVFESSPDPTSWEPVQKIFYGEFITLIAPAFQSAVNSGNLSLLSASLQDEIGYVYTRFDKCMSYSNQIMNFYATPIFSFSNDPNIVNREATRLVSKYNDHMSNLKKEIVEVLPKLESAKVDGKEQANKEKTHDKL